MNKKVRLELSFEELHEIYYVMSIASIKKNLNLAKYNVVSNVVDKVGNKIDKINKHEG